MTRPGGACGSPPKDASSDEVVEGVRAAARGESPLDPGDAGTVLRARTEPDPLASLSPRERDVLALRVQGLPNRLIARRLGITEKTVESHPTRVFRAVGVTDRMQAALWAERHGPRDAPRRPRPSAAGPPRDRDFRSVAAWRARGVACSHPPAGRPREERERTTT